MSKLFKGNYTEPLPVGTKVRLIEAEPLTMFTDESRDEAFVGQVFRVVRSADEVDGQTHQLDLKVDGRHNWWVYDHQIEVLENEGEK